MSRLAAFMRTNLLPAFHLTGWDPGWYDGFPLFTFYFPFPDLLAALGSYVIPGNIAFKFVTILGSLTLPVAAWAFGRPGRIWNGRGRRSSPRSRCRSCSTRPIQIYGGNLLSTIAGEYAYSLGLSVALIFLGVVLFGLRTGRLRWVAAVLFAIGVVCHLVTTMFAVVGIVIAFLIAPPSKRRAWWMISSVGAGALLIGLVVGPVHPSAVVHDEHGLLERHELRRHPAAAVRPLGARLGAVGLVIGVLRRQRAAVLLAGLGVVALLAVLFDPQGKLYNVRFLPLWFFCAYLLAGLAVAEGLIVLAQLWRAGRIALWRATMGLAPAWGSSQADEGLPDDELLPEHTAPAPLPKSLRRRSAVR